MSDAESEAYRWQKEFEEELDNLKNYIEKDEYIICSAIWFDDKIEYEHQPFNIKSGFVICGHRHHNCFNIMSILSNDIKKHIKYEKEQGFITNLNRFVDRKEGAEIAYKAGQTKTLLTRLYSEDLY